MFDNISLKLSNIIIYIIHIYFIYLHKSIKNNSLMKNLRISSKLLSFIYMTLTYLRDMDIFWPIF